MYVSYHPNKGEKVKLANKFETPGPATDSQGNVIGENTIRIAMMDDVNRRMNICLSRFGFSGIVDRNLQS